MFNLGAFLLQVHSSFFKMADSNKRKCLTAYDSSWKKDFPIGPTSQNKHGFYCHPCQKVISLGHMGRGHGANHYDPKGDSELVSF